MITTILSTLGTLASVAGSVALGIIVLFIVACIMLGIIVSSAIAN